METEVARERWPAGRLTWAILVGGALASCGAGVAAVAASSGSSGGGTTPALETFAVESPKDTPCVLHLAASQPVRVGLFFEAGGAEHAMANLMGFAGNIPGNEVDLTASETTLTWDFVPQIGAAFTPDVRLVAKRGGASIAGGELTLGLGNDAPEVRSIDQIEIDPGVPPDPGEASGTTGIELTVSDSSDDVVSVKVEFDVQGDVPDAGWQLARPALADPGAPTPLLGITDVQVTKDGTPLTFFWNTDADTDLHDLERDVALRFTATDGLLMGPPLESSAFRVDNNAPPIVQLQNDLVVTNPDERRGIPIPLRVIDEEGDLVEVVLQWRAQGQGFPSLDLDGDGELENTDIDAILADPVLRAERHVCTPYPHFARGLLVPVDADTVRLPELAGKESWLVASGLEGRTLELLRPSSIPAPITPAWRANPLARPASALSLGDGSSALVLDAPGAVRLQEIELATGAVVREVATLVAGLPSAICFEHGGEEAVLVAIDDAGVWRIERVELGSGAVAELLVSDGSEPGPVRGIASLGTKAAVFTAGSSLFRLDYHDALAPQLARLVGDLAAPAGVVVDPLAPDRIYLSERDANRVLAVELGSHEELPVVVRTADLQLGTLDHPTALALERDGSRLLVLTSAPGGQQLVGLDLGAAGGNVSFPIGTPSTVELASVSTGSDGLRLLCQPLSNEILVAGGLEQRRAIAAHATSTQDVSVAAPFDPLPRPIQPWRIPEDPRIRASAEGVPVGFVWDSAEPHETSAFVRAVARDDEVGVIAEGAASKSLRFPFDVEPLTLGGVATTPLPVSVAAADLDQDGDQDLVSANFGGSNLTVFFQVSPGSFQAPPLVLGGAGTTDGPAAVVAADLDGDGDQDLVSANRDGNDLTVFFQISPGSFQSPPLVLGGTATTMGPRSVAVADLDADGDQDLVSANSNGGNLTVFFQISPGSFTSPPLVLGGFPTTNFLVSVVAADLDGDGDQDLATAGGGLSVFFQVSPGNFQDPPFGDFFSGGANSVAAADLDGDGDQDLVTTSESCSDGCDNFLTVFFQRSAGVFSIDPQLLGGEGMTDGAISVVATDLDGDGDQDLVSANAGENDLAAFYQTTPGRFERKPLLLGSQASTSTPLSVAAADLDGDGEMDLVSANAGGNDLAIFFQSRPGVFAGEPDVLGGPNTTDRPVELAAGDLDGDGVLDLVSANDFNNCTIFSHLGPGIFGPTPLVLIAPVSKSSLNSVAVADMDGDGAQDIVTASSFTNELIVLFQRGPRIFPALVIDVSDTPSNPTDVEAADLDGDGDQDLVSSNEGDFPGGNLLVFFQVSPGNFEAPLVLEESKGVPNTVTAADLDGDGDLDLVSANSASESYLRVFFQGSPGSFVPTLGSLGTMNSPVSVAAADLDGDGDLDLVSANTGSTSSNLTVFFQSSPGSFQASPLVLGGNGTTTFPNSLAAADLDGDGDEDLVSANEFGSNLTVFFQASPGSFGVSPLVLGGNPATRFAVSVVTADLDGDGDQDLASANQGSSNLTVFWGGR